MCVINTLGILQWKFIFPECACEILLCVVLFICSPSLQCICVFVLGVQMPSPNYTGRLFSFNMSDITISPQLAAISFTPSFIPHTPWFLCLILFPSC